MRIHLLLIAIIAISGCITAGYKDCSDDKKCLESALKDCIKAKGEIKFYSDNNIYVEIRGMERNNCVLYEKMEGPDAKKYLDVINKRLGSSYKELDMTCKVPNDIETDLSDFANYCEGPLINFITTFSPE